MRSIKKIIGVLLAVLVLATMAACSEEPEAEEVKFTLGTVPAVMFIPELIQEYLEPPYEMEIVTFDGNMLPAVALNDGDIDSLMANHKPWIDTFNEENGSDLVMVEPYLYYSIFGLYSLEYSSIDEIPENGLIAMPGDATNMDRSLRVLQSAGLITLGEKTEVFYTLLDIVDNPKNLEFSETETTATVSLIQDCSAVITFSVLMKSAGFMPLSDYLLYEDPDIYPCGLVVTPENEDAPWVAAVIKATQSSEFKEKWNDYWQGAYILLEE